MKISVEVPDGKYCHGCIFFEVPQAFIHTCRLLDHKHLRANPSLEKRNCKNVWAENVIKDSECPSLKEHSGIEEGCHYLNTEYECEKGRLVGGRCSSNCVFYDDGSR